MWDFAYCANPNCKRQFSIKSTSKRKFKFCKACRYINTRLAKNRKKDKIKRYCKFCKKKFYVTSINNRKIFCTSKCRIASIDVKFTNNKNLSTGTVGAISEYIVSADLLSKGLPIFRALSPNCYCDIVILNKDHALAIEIRTGNINLKSGHGNFSTRTKHSIDLFAVYFPSIKKIYYESVTKLGKAFIKEYKLKKWNTSKKLL